MKKRRLLILSVSLTATCLMILLLISNAVQNEDIDNALIGENGADQIGGTVEANFIHIEANRKNLVQQVGENVIWIDGDHQPVVQKRILFWTKFFTDSLFGFGEGQGPFMRHNCSQFNCYTSANRNLIPLEDWDAIIFHGVDLNPADLPSRRSESQRYIFLLQEAPPATSALKKFNNFFNWTLSYRYDSDIPSPYSRIYPKSLLDDPRTPEAPPWLAPTPYDGPNMAAGKNRMAAIFVSHCPTTGKREELVKELSKHIQVDVYGGCGSMSCPRSDENKCRDMLDEHYKFYLAFENALCKDYVTEKFFNNVGHDVVLVVYGGADYSKIAPPHSYIDARSFPTAKHLADYLTLLDRNDDLYNQYFWWKKYYNVGTPPVYDCYCQMCHMLHTRTDAHVCEDLHDWWFQLGNCTNRRHYSLLGPT